MKKHFIFVMLIGLLTLITKTYAQNIGINETGNLPDTSAMLDISSSTKGLLLPRMTTTQRNAIPLPANGLVIYNTTLNAFNLNTGTPLSPNWEVISSGTGATTHTLSSSANTLTSTVNGIAATAPTVNTVANSSSVNNLTTTVNGINGSAVTMVNAVANTSSANNLSTTVNGVSGSTVSMVNSISNTSSTNNLTTTVNGVAGTAVPIINSNALALSGSNITSTINGIASSALDLTPAINSTAWKLTGNNGTSATTNFIGTTDNVDFITKTNNTERLRITGTGNVGIGINNPTYKLQVVSAANPLLLSGVQSGTSTDSLLSINTATGVVRYISSDRFASSGSSGGSGWNLTGNSGNTASSYLGTSDGQPITFKVNGMVAGYLGLDGWSYATSYGVSSNAGYQSTAIGAGATANTNNQSTAVGYGSEAKGFQSLAIGASAYTGAQNQTIAIGYNSNANAFQSIAIGAGATTSSNNNTMAVGNGANATGYQATAVGNGANATALNSTAIGNGASSTIDNYISIGNTTVSAIRGQVNFTTYSDGRFKRNIQTDVPGLDFIMKLRPVTYNWDIHKFNAYTLSDTYNATHAGYNPDKDEEAAILKKESITYTGFIAQEVEKAAQDCKFNFSGVLKPVSDKDAYSLSYAEFVVPLVKATQELNSDYEKLNNKINEQQKLIEQLLEEVKELRKKK
ncbi:MAG: tail fiber domain-containing protein [Ferruginibacter sp.]